MPIASYRPPRAAAEEQIMIGNANAATWRDPLLATDGFVWPDARGMVWASCVVLSRVVVVHALVSALHKIFHKIVRLCLKKLGLLKLLYWKNTIA